MYLKDLIDGLQELYASYTDEFKELAGEPEITIDLFEKQDTKTVINTYTFKGVTPNIILRRSYDGSVLVISAEPMKKKLKRQKRVIKRKQ